MCTVVPLDGVAVDQAYVGLVDECCGLEAVPGTFSGRAASGDPVQFVVNERDEPLEGAFVPTSTLQQQPSDF